MQTFRFLGLLLAYPDRDLIEAGPAMVRLMTEEGLLSGDQLAALRSLVISRAERDLLEVQEEYVQTFDRGRAHCLQLFEHIHGESRDRGQAMVSLVEAYAEKGLTIQARELPDYLPLFLEFLSVCPQHEAEELLGEAIEVIALIGERLRAKGSPYGVVFDALEALSPIGPDGNRLEVMRKNAPPSAETLEALDKEWQEAAAFGEPQTADCHACPSRSNASPLSADAGGFQ